MADTAWRDEVLVFWFAELTPEDWYTGKAEVDETIRDRFASLHENLKVAPPSEVWSDPRTALAAIILFDQFPRNIHRGKAAAFSTDDLALRIARDAIGRGFDAEMSDTEKQFLYMPLMHSETLADQERCVDLFKSLVARFGRFPHRNRALGRATTDAEAAFMEGHKGYGQ
jgi:uncharacterized protein (DUF924 family)